MSPGTTHGAIRNTPNGINAKLDISLSVRTVGAVTQSKESTASHGSRRRSAPLLGFLQRISLDAGLNQWAGVASRNRATCNARILALLGDGKMNGRPVQDVVDIMRRYEETAQATLKAEFEGFLTRIKTTPEATERGVAIAGFKSLEPSKYGFVIKIRQTFETFFASKQEIEAASKSFRYAWSVIGSTYARVNRPGFRGGCLV